MNEDKRLSTLLQKMRLGEVLRSHAYERIGKADGQTWGSIDGERLGPIEVEIHPTALCHRTCAFCSHIIRNRRGGELSNDDMDRLLVELKALGVKSIAFTGGGEPLFWKSGRIFDAIKTAAQFSNTILTSSGDQLWDDEREQLNENATIVLRNCRALQLNIPAVDDESFGLQVHGPSGWQRTRKIITALIAMKQSQPLLPCSIYAVVVISTFNVRQIGMIDATLSSLGLDGIYYKQMKNLEGRSVGKLQLSEESISEHLERIPSAQRSNDLDTFIQSLRVVYAQHISCWVNRIALSATVDPNGDIYLCTPTVGRPEFSIGNLDAGFTACWNSVLSQQVLRQLSLSSYEGVCPRECRHHADNQLIDQILH